ncbi:helix-turn-helix domain-containing protein [Leucobacter chromiisoli]|uniref:helix-turn-helix domain-containing protein n=1 Tax=Leucobacter chromiisoli TaxID=2796471 RepID=UPI0027DD2FC9|nr:XRE family transcriptional regulator [Leucobacter chromiisoli]
MIGDVGGNLRELRAQSGMSLRELAAATGLSATLLSQVERGISEPSLKTLRALSSVFGDAVSSLFASPGPVPIHVSRPGERSRISSPAGRIQYERLTPNNGQIEVLRGSLQPGDWSSDEAWAHEAIECVYVDRGRLEVEVEGQRFEVRTGESITFSSRQPHRYGNTSEDVTTFLLSVSPPTP